MKKLLVALLVLAGCRTDAPPTAVEQAAKATPPHVATNTYYFTAKAYIPAKRACWGCHAVASPDGQGYPAGVEIHLTGGPTGSHVIVPGTIQDMMDAMADDRAPANHPLTGGERDTLMQWAIAQGAVTVNTTVPSTFSWSFNTHTQYLTFGSTASGYQPGGFHSFAVERIDVRANLKLDNYQESSTHCCSSSPNNGHAAPYNLPALWMSYYNSTTTDSFTASDDGTFYISPAGVPWNSRLKGAKWYRGYVQIRNRLFIAVDVMEDRRGFTVGNRRGFRDYVRFQVEGNSNRKAGFRMKKTGFADDYETVGAWESHAGPSELTDDGAYSMIVTDTNGWDESLWNDAWYFMEVQVYDESGYEHFRGRLYDDDPSTNQNAALIVECGAKRSGTGKYGGFAWGWYERQDAQYNRIAGWTVTADAMQGAGTHPASNCRLCELEEALTWPDSTGGEEEQNSAVLR